MRFIRILLQLHGSFFFLNESSHSLKIVGLLYIYFLQCVPLQDGVVSLYSQLPLDRHALVSDNISTVR